MEDSNLINYILAIILSFFVINFFARRKALGKGELDDNIKTILKESKKGKLNYSRLFKLIQVLKE